MSPEQARGEEVDARSDLFSFGVMLYHMVTGHLAFPGKTSAVIFEGILNKTPVPPRQLNPEIPDDLERIIAKALEKDRNLRSQGAAELRADLKRFQRSMLMPVSSPITAERRVGPRPAFLWIWAVAVIGVVSIALAGWFLMSHGAAPFWKNAAFLQLTNQSGQETFPSLSPDGKSFVFASKAAGNWDIYLQRVGGKNPINLTKDSPADDTQPAFSPDGERIAFRSERDGGGIFVMGATGESAKRLTDFGYYPAWSPDGRQIVCSTSWFFEAEDVPAFNSQLFVFSAGGSSALADRRPLAVKIEFALQPQWSPGGRRIAFWSQSGGNRDVWTVQAAGGEPVRVTHEPSTDWHPVWSPDGKYLYFLSDRRGSMNLWRVPIDESSGRAQGPAEQVPTPSAYTSYFSFSRDGRRVAYVNKIDGSNIYKVEFDPARETVVGSPGQITQGSWRAQFPDVSPDGQWLAFAGRGKQEDLFVSRADGSNVRQLTDDEYLDRTPRWSPDGKRVGFHSTRSGAYQIWTIAPDGSELRQMTRMVNAGTVYWPTWSPDGARVAFNIERRLPVIMQLSQPWDERSLESLPPLESGSMFFVFSWSPDGRRIAGHRVVGTVHDGISVYSLESHQYKHFTDFGFQPRWLSDSRRLIFWNYQGLYLLDTGSGKFHKILDASPNRVMGVSPFRDGREIYFGLLTTEADIWLMSSE
jgi:Tol biopolymer transport system component